MSDKWTQNENAGDCESDIAKVNEMIEGIRFGMFTTLTEEGALHSRPMAAQELDANNALWFMTSSQSGKVKAIAHDKQVNVAFGSPSKNEFLSLAGTAQVLVDKEKIKELWSPAYLAWFPKGVDDPDICLIRVDVETAEYWDSPSSKVVYLIGLAKAAMTGQPYKAGPDENGRVRMENY